MNPILYPSLFSQFKTRGFVAKNRVAMAPMATNFASADGSVTERMIEYYAARARGGVGTVIVENTNVDYPQGANGAVQLRIDEDRFIPGLSTLVERVRMHGARVVLQINHAGASTRRERTLGLQPVAPSPIPASRGGEIPRQITEAEMEQIVQKFARAAGRAKRAGFDSVEIHAGHSYLLAQFMSPLTNKRDDAFGGSLENRMRFPLEVVRAVRRAVGDDYPLVLRFSADEFVEGGRTAVEAIPIASMFRDAGIDVLHVSAGNGYSLFAQIEPMPYEEGWKTYLAADIRKKVGIPVIAVGSIRKPEFAEHVVRDGIADLVAIGRGLIADPEWCNKAASGRSEDICPCISCNVGCVGSRVFADEPIKCAVNPLAGREWLFGDIASDRFSPGAGWARRVVVIGGGPAGLTAALYAKRAGLDVTLFEQSDSTGGQMRIAAIPPGKSKIGWFIQHLNKAVADAGVKVVCGVTADADTVREMAPDAVIVATGSRPVLPPIPGLAKALMKNAFTAHDVLAGKVNPAGSRVVICGGGLVGCETALYLAEKRAPGRNNSIILVEMLPEIGRDVDPVYKDILLCQLRDFGVVMLNSRRIVAFDDGILRTEPCRPAADRTPGQSGALQDEWAAIPYDCAVIALGACPATDVCEQVHAEFALVAKAGDCERPGKIIDAVWRGFLAAMSVTGRI